jgi:protein tyrosine phosphatase
MALLSYIIFYLVFQFQGYENPYKFIVTQTPMPNTVEDFISMLYQEKCACVISLDDENLKDKVRIHL